MDTANKKNVINGETTWCDNSCHGIARCDKITAELEKEFSERNFAFISMCKNVKDRTPQIETINSFGSIDPKYRVGTRLVTQSQNFYPDIATHYKGVLINDYYYVVNGDDTELIRYNIVTGEVIYVMFDDISIVGIDLAYCSDIQLYTNDNHLYFCAYEQGFLTTIGELDISNIASTGQVTGTIMARRTGGVDGYYTATGCIIDGHTAYVIDGGKMESEATNLSFFLIRIDLDASSSTSMQIMPKDITPIFNYLNNVNGIVDDDGLLFLIRDIELIYANDDNKLCFSLERRNFFGFDYSTHTQLWAETIELSSDAIPGSALLELSNDWIIVPNCYNGEYHEAYYTLNWRTHTDVVIPSIDIEPKALSLPSIVNGTAYIDYIQEDLKVSCYNNNLVAFQDNASGVILKTTLGNSVWGVHTSISDIEAQLNTILGTNSNGAFANWTFSDVVQKDENTIWLCLVPYYEIYNGDIPTVHIFDISDPTAVTLVKSLTADDGVMFPTSSQSLTRATVANNKFYFVTEDSSSSATSSHIAILLYTSFDIDTWALEGSYKFVDEPGGYNIPILTAEAIIPIETSDRIGISINGSLRMYEKKPVIDIYSDVAIIPFNLLTSLSNYDAVNYLTCIDGGSNSILLLCNTMHDGGTTSSSSYYSSYYSSGGNGGVGNDTDGDIAFSYAKLPIV